MVLILTRNHTILTILMVQMAVLMYYGALTMINRYSCWGSIVNRLSYAALALNRIGSSSGLTCHPVRGDGSCILNMMVRISHGCTHIVGRDHIVLLLLLGHNATFKDMWNILSFLRRRVHFTVSIVGPNNRGCLAFLLECALNHLVVVIYTSSTVRIRLRINLVTGFSVTETFLLSLNQVCPI